MAKVNKYAKPDESRKAVPHSTQDTIEIAAIAEDGIFQIQDKRFSKTYRFSDVNYAMLSEDEQIEFIYKYLKTLSALSVPYKLTTICRKRDEVQFQQKVFMQMTEDGKNALREDFNNIIDNRIQEGRRGIEEDMLITLVAERDDYESAKNYFITLESQVLKGFQNLGSVIEPLKCKERLKILYDFYRSGEEQTVSFDWWDFDKTVESARDFLNDIAPSNIQFFEDYIKMGNQYLRAMCMRNMPSQLDNGFIQLLKDTSVRMLMATDVRPLPKMFANDLLNSKYRNVESKIRKQQKIRNKNNDFSSDISFAVQEEKKDVADIMHQVREQDMNLAYGGFTILIQADSKEELERDTEKIKALASGESFILDCMIMKQREGLNTVLPIGICQTSYMRTMTTSDLTSLLPFNSQELMLDGGLYYGINQISKKLIIGNRRMLRNGNGWIFGGSGSGKSVCAKFEIVQNLLMSRMDSKNEVIIIDPLNEYEPLVQPFDGQYIDIRPATPHRINGFEIPDSMSPNEITANKLGWVIGVLEQIYGKSLDVHYKNVVEKALRMLYAPYENGAIQAKEHQPTMTEFRNILVKMSQENDQSVALIAQDISMALEMFTVGTLNMFGGESNVDINAPLVVYGFRDIPKDILSLAMYIIMESLQQRTYSNFLKGIATWIYIDEAHELLKLEQSANYMDVLWRELRKYFGFCTGITHEVSDVCKNSTSKAMINVAEFCLLLPQKDTTIVQEVYKLTDEQIKYVSDAESSGLGLIRHGKTVIPFDNIIPTNSKIYSIINTDPNKHEQKTVG